MTHDYDAFGYFFALILNLLKQNSTFQGFLKFSCINNTQDF